MAQHGVPRRSRRVEPALSDAGPFGPFAARLELTPGQDFWVFGYGSLLWHPGFPHIEVRPAHLYGYHRHFCVYSHVYRGTPERPGLVLGLDHGGSCRGLAYRVPASEGREAMDYLYEREMITAVYCPRWVGVHSEQGQIRVAAFIVDRAHRQYAGRLPEAEVVELIVAGCGDNGSNIDYLENTVRHLDALGLSDRTLTRLLRLVRARCPR